MSGDGQALLEWMSTKGGGLHESLQLRQDAATGLSVFASAPVASSSRLVSCPFSLAITPQSSRAAIIADTGAKEDDLAGWTEKMLIGTYLCLHWAAADTQRTASSSWPSSLGHRTYVEALPPVESLLTPLQWTENELTLLEGTNLHGAIVDRRRTLREEYDAVSKAVKDDGVTWERYLAAATYISSRAFPSKLLQLPEGETAETSPKGVSEEEESHPVLLPGLDLFNHARGQPITWLSSPISTGPSDEPIPSVSFVNPSDLTKGEQVYNNYGPKSNEELLLSYGFVIDRNPDDSVILKLGTAIPLDVSRRLEANGLDAGKRFALNSEGEIPRDLLAVMRVMLDNRPAGDHAHEHEHNHDCDEDEDDEHEAHEREMRELELEMDVLGSLGGMLEDKLKKFEAIPTLEGVVREEVKRMCSVYREGQIRILELTLDKLGDRVERLEGLLDQGMGSCACGC